MKSTTYKEGVLFMSAFMDDHPRKINAFDASLILAYIFPSVSKERALNDLMKHRSKSL